MSLRRLELVEPERPPVMAADKPTLRVAIATQDMKAMNAHFGSARKFAVYELTPHDHRFVAAMDFQSVSEETGSHQSDGDDRIAAKVEALAGCNLLFVLAIGGPAAAKVVASRIHPVKLAAPESIQSIIAKVQALMTGNAPPWLRKAMGEQRARTMDFLDEED